MYSKSIQKFFIFIFTILVLYGLQSGTANAQSGSIDWGGWTLDYEIGVQDDGIAIRNVQFQGTEVLGRGSFPAMPVYYNNNICGPYLDRLDGDLSTVDWANNARVVSRQFTTNGEQWYELGIRQFIGQYDIYQVWYFNSNGVLDAHLFSRGLQCQVYHEHWPHWRFDFDIAGADNDQILYQTANGEQTYSNEFNVNATTATNHGWIVRDMVTNDQVRLDFDTGTWNPPGTIVPETQYAQNRVAGRRHNTGEESWHRNGHGSLPANWDGGADRIGYGNNESITDTDIVLWYSGYLPHSANEGAALWHSTGVRMTLETGNPPPTDTPTPTATATANATAIPNATATPDATATPGTGPGTGTSELVCNVYTSTDVPQGLPQGNESADSLLNVADNLTITDMSVSLNMDHTWMGDMQISIVHPDTGTSATLIDRPGNPGSLWGCDRANIEATFSEGAAATAEDQCETTGTAITGTFQPMTTLAAFNGESSGGSWQLSLTDMIADEYVGTLNSWSLEICSLVPVVPTATPTLVPTDTPTAVPPTPTLVPTDTPTLVPTDMPTAVPTDMPTAVPTDMPTAVPTDMPTAVPTDMPTAVPTDMPTAVPTDMPTAVPTDMPTAVPTDMPTAVPTDMPTAVPPTPTPQSGNDVITVRLDGGQIESDGTITVPIDVLLNESGQVVAAIGVDITYDDTVVTAGNCTFASDFTGACNTNLPGQVSISSINVEGSGNDFSLATIDFSAVGSNGDTTDLNITVNTLSDLAGQDLPNYQTENGQINIADYIVGDANCDGVSNTVDALFVMQYDVLLRNDIGGCPLNDAATELNAQSGDVNNDNNTNTIDALFIIQCDVGMNNVFCPAPPAQLNAAAMATAPMLVDAEMNGNRITVSAEGRGKVAAGKFTVTYDHAASSFSGCTAPTSTALIVCREKSAGNVEISYIDPQGSSAGPLVEVTLNAKGRQSASLEDFSTISLADINGKSLLDN